VIGKEELILNKRPECHTMSLCHAMSRKALVYISIFLMIMIFYRLADEFVEWICCYGRLTIDDYVFCFLYFAVYV